MRNKYYSQTDDLFFVQKFYEVMYTRVPLTFKDYIRSLRRPKAMCSFLTSLYICDGRRLPKHYIYAARYTSLPQLQDLAEQVARGIILQEKKHESTPELENIEFVISKESVVKRGQLEQTTSQVQNLVIRFIPGSKGSSGKDRLLRWIKRDEPPDMKEWMDTITRTSTKYYRKFMSKRRNSADFKLKSFQVGDDPCLVDFDATIQNLNDQGIKLEYLRYEDIIIRKPRKRRLCVVFLHDISISMIDMIFITNSIVSSLLQVFRSDEIAIGLFGDDFYVMKEMDEQENIDRLSFSILALKAGGGTMLVRGINWAKEQFSNISGDTEKVCFIISDFNLYSPQLTFSKIKELLRDYVKIIEISTNEIKSLCENIDNRIVDVSSILRDVQEPEELLCKVLDKILENLFSYY